MKCESAITNLDKFMQWTRQFKDGEYLFRGVSKSCHIKNNRVEASVARRLENNEDKYPETLDKYPETLPKLLLEINRDMIEKARLLGHTQRNGQDLSDLDLLAEFQHYGAATCLIDFTYNALIALWFACRKVAGEKEKKCPKNGKVVVLRGDGMEPLTRVDYQMSKQNIDFFFKVDKTGKCPIYQWQPKHQNNRIIAQQSVFVFSGAPIEIFGSCEIDIHSKENILAELEALTGISDTSLFSDFDGFAWLHAHDKPYVRSTSKAYRIKAIEISQKADMEREGDIEPKEYRERALQYLNSAIAANRESGQERIENYIELGRTYLFIGRTAEAINTYNRVLENESLRTEFLENPSEVAIMYNALGLAYSVEERFDEAINAFNEAIELDPNLAKAYNNCAMAHTDKPEPELDRALENYDKAIEIRPDYGTAYCNRGETKMLLAEWASVKKDLEAARDLGVDIIDSFREDYESVEHFNKKTGLSVPTDIATMLTPEPLSS